MQAVILAAGMGKRLKDLTADNTKCMVKVNGVTLIERMLKQLNALKLSKIVIVIGYEGKKLTDYIESLNIETPILYIDNPVYYKTNNIYSLALAKEHLKREDTLLLESDLIFEDSVLETLLNDQRETLALVDKYESWMDGTVVKLDEEDNIHAFIGGKKIVFDDIPAYYKTVNIYKFSKHFSEQYYVPFLEAYSSALGNNEYYEQVLKVITMLDDPEIKAKRLEGQRWYEIDDVQDLDIAESIFSESEEEKLSKIQKRYGGYWRYPKILDFCYLVNPYFPPQRLLDEIKSNFDTLVTQYPSGMYVNALLAAKNVGVKQDYIVVGKGAAELIKALLERYDGKIGFIRPTFEEYPNRYDADKSVIFDVKQMDFQYHADDIMKYYEDRKIDMLILINPDNPSGNYIEKEDLHRLCQWCDDREIDFVVDESFVDFAEGEDNTLICNEILEKYKKLIVVKSISKSYGVPGLRLGVLVSSRETLIKELRKEVAIWNINSFAEFYMQIAEKYTGDYKKALEQFQAVRSSFVDALKKIDGLKVYPTQANFVMCEVCNGISAAKIARDLLIKHNLFIKDLTEKIGNGKQYIRLAVRKQEENEMLIEALKEIWTV